jgi:hypothetical protein
MAIGYDHISQLAKLAFFKRNPIVKVSFFLKKAIASKSADRAAKIKMSINSKN